MFCIRFLCLSFVFFVSFFSLSKAFMLILWEFVSLYFVVFMFVLFLFLAYQRPLNFRALLFAISNSQPIPIGSYYVFWILESQMLFFFLWRNVYCIACYRDLRGSWFHERFMISWIAYISQHCNVYGGLEIRLAPASVTIDRFVSNWWYNQISSHHNACLNERENEINHNFKLILLKSTWTVSIPISISDLFLSSFLY